MYHDRTAIEILLTEFGRHADRGDGDALSLLFLPNGTLSVNAKVAEGQEQIARFTNERTADPTRSTRHVWSNLHIENADSEHIQASCLQMTFEKKGDIPGAVRINDVLDSFGRTAEGEWRFANRVITPQITVGG